MNVSLLVQVCGWQLLIVIGALAVGLLAAAVYLSFVVRRESLLTAFMPLTALPAVAGLLVTFLDMLSSIGMQLDTSTSVAMEPGFLLQMNLVPLLVGLIAATPAAVIAVAARWALTWQANFPRPTKPKPESRDESPGNVKTRAAWIAKETDDYLEQLVRPR